MNEDGRRNLWKRADRYRIRNKLPLSTLHLIYEAMEKKSKTELMRMLKEYIPQLEKQAEVNLQDVYDIKLFLS